MTRMTGMTGMSGMTGKTGMARDDWGDQDDLSWLG